MLDAALGSLPPRNLYRKRFTLKGKELTPKEREECCELGRFVAKDRLDVYKWLVGWLW